MANKTSIRTAPGPSARFPIRDLASMVTRSLAVLLVTACMPQRLIAANLDPAKPNVLLVYFDDMGYGDMGANQPTGLKIPENSAYLDPASPTLTPRLDAFAEQSLRFTNGHSADGVCTPSRYALMTGRYCWRTDRKKGVLGGYSKTILNPDRLTIGRMFQQLGYTTAMVGKWHIGMQFYGPDGQRVDLGNRADVLEKNLIDFSKPLTDTPYHRGFDYYFGTPASLDMPPYTWIESDAKRDAVHVLYRGGRGEDGKVDFGQARIAKNSDFIEGKVKDVSTRPGVQDPTFVFADYLQVQAEKVKDILARRDQDGRPFFIYVPMPAPHTPHTVQEQFKGSAGFVYGDYVVQTDYYTGVILDALGDPSDPDSPAANTVVFITSDNGPENGAFHSSNELNHDANGPFAGRKRDNYEGGTRVPFMVRWPGQVKPGTTDHPCWQGDFMATMADYLGYALKAGEAPDAESFLPVLFRKPMPKARRQAFIQHSSQGQFAVVDQTGEWKLLDGTGGGGNGTTCDADNNETLKRGDIRGTPRQLFNLHKDPGERNNLLVDDPANPNDNADPTPEALAKERELYALLNAIRGDTTWGDGAPMHHPPVKAVIRR